MLSAVVHVVAFLPPQFCDRAEGERALAEVREVVVRRCTEKLEGQLRKKDAAVVGLAADQSRWQDLLEKSIQANMEHVVSGQGRDGRSGPRACFEGAVVRCRRRGKEACSAFCYSCCAAVLTGTPTVYRYRRWL